MNVTHDEFSDAVATKIESLDAERFRLVDALERAIAEERDVRILARELDGLAPPGSRLQLFSIGSSRRGDPLSKNKRAALEALRQTG